MFESLGLGPFRPRIRLRSFEQQRCLITGAASGIGRATAIACAEQGAELFLTDVNEQKLAEVAELIRRAGGTVTVARALDLTNFEAVAAFARAIHDTSGPMNVVMNIAGISVWGTVQNLRHEHWKKAIDVNLMGPIHVIECFVPAMIASGAGGYLVNVSSAAGLFGLPWHAAYSASKFGLRGISEVLRFDLERHGIGVSLVCPGGVDTPLVNTVEILGVDRSSPAFQKMVAHFRERAVTPEQAARAIVRGVQRGDYLVFTSRDIRVGYWFQQKWSFLYEHSMRKLNDRMQRLVERSGGSSENRRTEQSPQPASR